MEIKIDTSKDSSEDIKKMIKFLQHFINENHDSSVIPDAGEGMFNIFGDDDTPSMDFMDNPIEPEKDDDPDVEILPYD